MLRVVFGVFTVMGALVGLAATLNAVRFDAHGPVQFALASPFPAPEEATKHVYA